MELTTRDLLAIIGEKDIELRFLRQKIATLEALERQRDAADEAPTTDDERTE